MNQFIEIDMRYRRKLFIAYACSISLGLVLVLVLSPLIREYLVNQRGEEYIATMELLQFALLALPILPALFLIWFGGKVVVDKQYPYKGKKVIRRTRIIVGKRAIGIGGFLIMSGVVPILLIITSMILTHSINSTFLESPFEYVPRFFWNR